MCNDISISEITPNPAYQDFTENINLKLTGNLNDGNKYKIRIDCSVVCKPTSDASIVINKELQATIIPNDIARCRECLQITYRTGPKNILLLTESNGLICKLGSFQTQYHQTCQLNINPQIINPGGTITISSNDAPNRADLTLIIYEPSGTMFSKEPVSGNNFSKTKTAPSQEGDYTVKLSSADETNFFCEKILRVQINPPTGTITPIISPSSKNPPFDPCGNLDPVSLKNCQDCLGFTGTPDLHNPAKAYTKIASKTWTALGCIPTDPGQFISWLLPAAIGIAGGLAFLLIIYGAFTILTSSGNPEKLNSGKEILISALAGLLLIIFSVFILKLIGVDILGIPGFKI